MVVNNSQLVSFSRFHEFSRWETSSSEQRIQIRGRSPSGLRREKIQYNTNEYNTQAGVNMNDNTVWMLLFKQIWLWTNDSHGCRSSSQAISLIGAALEKSLKFLPEWHKTRQEIHVRNDGRITTVQWWHVFPMVNLVIFLQEMGQSERVKAVFKAWNHWNPIQEWMFYHRKWR